MNIFALSRRWFDFCFQNPEMVRPTHTAIYFFAIEHCNRMGWKRKYGFPTTMVMEAIGVKSYTTYKQTLDELVEWGFIQMVERSRNQFSANIIALSFFDEAYTKATDEALDKAMIKHASKQRESNESIDIPINQLTKEPLNKEEKRKRFTPPTLDAVKAEMGNDIEAEKYIDFYASKGWKVGKTPMVDWKASVRTWKRNMKQYPSAQPMSTREQFANYGDSVG